ncbi:unnamed protein product [Arctogadus glacialis]
MLPQILRHQSPQEGVERQGLPCSRGGIPGQVEQHPCCRALQRQRKVDGGLLGTPAIVPLSKPELGQTQVLDSTETTLGVNYYTYNSCDGPGLCGYDLQEGETVACDTAVQASIHDASIHLRPGKAVWPFNVSGDPYERFDRAERRADVVKLLLARLAFYSCTAAPVSSFLTA